MADTDPNVPGLPPIPPLVIGEPFALAEGVELLERVGLDEATVRRELEKGRPGCSAVVKCDGPEDTPCGQMFRVDLLQPGLKSCPKCKTKYTHVLLIAPADDDDIIADAMAQVLSANGYQLPGGDDDEGDEDDEGDDDESDDQADDE